MYDLTEAFFVLALKIKAGNEIYMAEQKKARAFEHVWHLAQRDALSQPSTIAVLPTPASPTSTGLFFDCLMSTVVTLNLRSRQRIRLELVPRPPPSDRVKSGRFDEMGRSISQTDLPFLTDEFYYIAQAPRVLGLRG